MTKLLADKKTKQLLTDSKIRELGLNIGNFTANWQGRLNILNPEKSRIAKELTIQEKGEYAIKLRG